VLVRQLHPGNNQLEASRILWKAVPRPLRSIGVRLKANHIRIKGISDENIRTPYKKMRKLWTSFDCRASNREDFSRSYVLKQFSSHRDSKKENAIIHTIIILNMTQIYYKIIRKYFSKRGKLLTKELMLQGCNESFKVIVLKIIRSLQWPCSRLQIIIGPYAKWFFSYSLLNCHFHIGFDDGLSRISNFD
jgi:hypothetical protein